VNQLEPSTDSTGTSEQGQYLIRQGIRDDVKILGLVAQHQVTNATAYQAGIETGVLQSVEDLDGATTDLFPGNRVIGTGDDLGFRDR